MAPTLISGLINNEGSEKNLNDLKILNKDQSNNSKLRTSVLFSKKETDKTIETVFLEPDANRKPALNCKVSNSDRKKLYPKLNLNPNTKSLLKSPKMLRNKL
jgi:hypothetical protein